MDYQAELPTKKLSSAVGAEVLDVDRDRLLHDPAMPGAILEALDEHGVLLFREIGLDDQEQVAFGRRLGDLVARAGHEIPEITSITQDPENPLAEYLRGNLFWHIDGALDDIPCRAGMLSARIVTAGDGGTEFASTYAAYDDLTEEEKERCARLSVVHTLESTLLPVYPHATAEQIAGWRSRSPAKEHPLVWRHRSGRKSLVFGSTADHVVGMDVEEGRALLADLVRRSTTSDRVLRHDWAVGDAVLWDNTGVVHRVTKHESTSRRELHRITVVGDEPIE